jgi:hypothetical protein
VPPGPSTSRPSLARQLLGGAAVAAAWLALVMAGGWRWPAGARPPAAVAPPRPAAAARPATAPPAPALPGTAARGQPAPPPPAPEAPGEAEALARALGEERVRLASGVVVEAVEQERPWVCEGEALGLRARVAGAHEPGALTRWVWPAGPDGRGAELQPGPVLRWQAPARAGRYRVHVQVCRDLGGRRVGVLAERSLTLEVRACAPADRQAHAPWRLAVSQRGAAAFRFEALRQGGGAPARDFAWDFGDGTTARTSGPHVEHAFAPPEGPADEGARGYTVRVRARLADGTSPGASALVQVRGRAPEAPAAAVRLESAPTRAEEGGGWRTDLLARAAEGEAVTWERVERLTRHRDGRLEVRTLRWEDAVRVEEALGGGGFRGAAVLPAGAVAPDVKQVLDVLTGRTARGLPVEVSWSAYKAPPPADPEGAARPALHALEK